MSSNDREAAILLADIIGSTPLYEAVGDASALRQVADCLDQLQAIVAQEGGTFLRSKGDDVLCTFDDPSCALRAVRQMLWAHSYGSLAIHAGIHYGRVIHARGDIFGDAVNLTARLASLAKAGEVLISAGFVDRLPEADIPSLRELDAISLKGRSTSTKVYSLLEDDSAQRTEITALRGSTQSGMKRRRSAPELTVALRYKDLSRLCNERARVSIGRSPDCDIVIEQPWVSRKHAILSLQHGKVQLEDCSSSGTYVAMQDGHEVFVRRETLLLTGLGTISPTVPASDKAAELIHFEVTPQRNDQTG